MDVSGVPSAERSETLEGSELGSLLWAHRLIEEVKAGLREDPGRAYSSEFTRASEVLREHDPVQFNSLRRLLKGKQVRLGEFDRLIELRRRERAESRKRDKAVASARTSRTADAFGQFFGHPPTVKGGQKNLD
jgi:hypothetical protein